MNWYSGQLNIYDGKTLEIILPVEVLSLVETPDEYTMLYTVEIPLRTIEKVSKIYLAHSMKEAIRFSLKDLLYSIEWMRDSNREPPSNHKVYDLKCVVALRELSELYEEEYPELFI